ncbi:MAG TPA: methylenetetrahydrofolate reductase C-terminal domain-containing protein [Opitutaceae bacterium]|nr:methylenetetrahydrofolate reductase C-terminal domain-containing protein [Opitutaceae bacterium]
MTPLAEKFARPDAFLTGVELVSTRGTTAAARAGRTVAFARDLAGSGRVDWVSITDNAGGNPHLAPSALGRPLREAAREVVIHLSCKDFNRNGVESEAWRLASEGFHNLLALSGDAPGKGVAGGAKSVFDLDSVGLLALLGQMNAGIEITRPDGGRPMRLEPAQFFLGAVVTNFKLRENEVVPQLLKLEKKIACGARWVVNQIGYDSRKVSELIAYLRHRGLGSTPLVGNVYVLNPVVARLFRAQRIPGVVISDELAEVCERHAGSPDKGRAFFRELAAKQIAIYRGLGYRGAYIGGVHTHDELDAVLDLAARFAPGDWREFAREVRYARPGEFFCFPADPATGLADPTVTDFPGLAGDSHLRPGGTVAYRFSKLIHGTMFTPGRGLWHLGRRHCAGARDSWQGSSLMRTVERVSKGALFGCKDCGDCSLPDIAFQCPESACAKNQRNGPCGGTRDGQCEVADVECMWSIAYDRLKAEGRAEELLSHAPVIQDQALRGTSSWANTWLGRDHHAKPLAVAVTCPEPATSEPLTASLPIPQTTRS